MNERYKAGDDGVWIGCEHCNPQPAPAVPSGGDGPERFHFEADRLTILVPEGIVSGHRYGFTLWTHIESEVAMIERTINKYIDAAYHAGRTHSDGSVAEIVEAAKGVEIALIAVAPTLEKPFDDDPRWSPWTRFVEPKLDKLIAASAAARTRLGGGDRG